MRGETRHKARNAPAAKRSGCLSAKREPRRGRKGPRGIPPTKHCGAYRREDDGSGGAGSGREAETPSTAPNSTRGAMRGHGRGRSGAEPAKMRRVAQDCDPKTYMYMSSISPEAVGRIAKRALAGCRMDARIGHFSWYPPTTEGRSPRSGCPSRGASTVAPAAKNLSIEEDSHRADARGHVHDGHITAVCDKRVTGSAVNPGGGRRRKKSVSAEIRPSRGDNA